MSAMETFFFTDYYIRFDLVGKISQIKLRSLYTISCQQQGEFCCNSILRGACLQFDAWYMTTLSWLCYQFHVAVLLYNITYITHNIVIAIASCYMHMVDQMCRIRNLASLCAMMHEIGYDECMLVLAICLHMATNLPSSYMCNGNNFTYTECIQGFQHQKSFVVQNLMFRQQVLLPSSEKEQYNWGKENTKSI